MPCCAVTWCDGNLFPLHRGNGKAPVEASVLWTETPKADKLTSLLEHLRENVLGHGVVHDVELNRGVPGRRIWEVTQHDLATSLALLAGAAHHAAPFGDVLAGVAVAVVVLQDGGLKHHHPAEEVLGVSGLALARDLLARAFDGSVQALLDSHGRDEQLSGLGVPVALLAPSAFFIVVVPLLWIFGRAVVTGLRIGCD